MAGVDYYVGPTAGTSFSDPATNIPAGCTYTASTGGSTTNQLRCSNNNTTITGLDFTLHNGVNLLFNTGLTGISIHDNKFCDGPGSDGGIDQPIIGWSNHGQAGSMTVYNNDISGSCAGVLGKSGGLLYDDQTGVLNFHHNYCHDFAQHCIDASLDANLTSSNMLLQYNLVVNSGLAVGAHGEFAYFCGGTYAGVVQNFNTALNQYPLIKGSSGLLAMSADTSCSLLHLITGTTVGYNTALAQGTQAAINWPNPSGQTSAYVFFITADSSSSITATNNYIDYEGGFGPYYAGTHTGVTYTSSVNIVTGNACGGPDGTCN